MPTVVHAPGARPLSTGQLAGEAHGRPSLHSLRSSPLHTPLAQSAPAPHGAPEAPVLEPGPHTLGPRWLTNSSPHAGWHIWPFAHMSPNQHAEHTAASQMFEAHSPSTTHCSPSSRELAGIHADEPARTGAIGSRYPHTSA